jgi:ribonucleoside-diphosphate reductase alpha chain
MIQASKEVVVEKVEEVRKSGKIAADRSGRTVAGLEIERVFSTEGVHPFEQIEWELRTASIKGEKGEEIFSQDNVEVPKSWSVLATNICASKYFYGAHGSAERESSVKALIHRVARTIADSGLENGYFKTEADAEVFYNELAYLCVNQYGAFNSPVWFNCGLYHEYGVGNGSAGGSYYYDQASGEFKLAQTQYEYPQCSACFIQSVDDTMEDIMQLAASEAALFKFGSGTGTDLSTIRSSRERLSGGGEPSGPMSFLKVYDSIAGVVKSGGKTRRAAKMNSLKCWHPDIKEFILSKKEEEKKAWALIESGYSPEINGEAYASVSFQNENLSVRVTDDFMKAVQEDRDWKTHWVTDPGREGPTYKARDLLRWIADGTWTCGDPGLQYEDSIQKWHTCKNTGPINASNPCSEYMFLDNSACNLASVNLIKFLCEDGSFDTERYRAAARTFILAQEILVDSSSYPTKRIAVNSHRFRPLGLGYANLGAMLMSMGLPYDSDDGRAIAGALTAIMTFEAYRQSAEIAGVVGPFEGYADNSEPMQEVMEQHKNGLLGIGKSCPDYLVKEAVRTANAAIALGDKQGYRNAQVTVLAPTGTIGFLMDCDTTGIEPDIALVKYKALVGGGLLKIVNQSVRRSLDKLGYSQSQIDAIVAYIDQHDTIEGAPELQDGHLPVFDCAFKARNGKRSIHYYGHLKMMAAVQPFLSGAISKTVNMPEDTQVDEIMQTYIDGWEMGLKAVAVYRDGCKRCQPLNTKSGADKEKPISGNGAKNKPLRKRMPATRSSLTHKFDIAGHEGYLTVGLYDNGMPGELFITMAKEGSTIGGLMDSFGTAISMCLQYGVPLESLCGKFAHSRFEPSGFTKNPDIPIAKSLMDYIFRWMKLTFIENRVEMVAESSADEEVELVAASPASPAVKQPTKVDDQFKHFMDDAPACDVCGAITVRNGACYKCFNCGNSMGCS